MHRSLNRQRIEVFLTGVGCHYFMTSIPRLPASEYFHFQLPRPRTRSNMNARIKAAISKRLQAVSLAGVYTGETTYFGSTSTGAPVLTRGDTRWPLPSSRRCCCSLLKQKCCLL